MEMLEQDIKYCTKSHPIRLGDLLYIFSDGYGHVNYNVEITDGDATVTFEDFPELSEEISNYDNCIVTSAHVEDCWLCIYVKDSKYCAESSPIRVGDLLNLFSDNKGCLNFNVELSDFDAGADFEAPVELSKYISQHFDCVCRSCYWEDGCLCIYVKEL